MCLDGDYVYIYIYRPELSSSTVILRAICEWNGRSDSRMFHCYDYARIYSYVRLLLPTLSSSECYIPSLV